MSLFQFGKKDNINTKMPDGEQLLQKVNIREQAYTNTENRRMVLLIEETFPAQGNDGIVTVGTVRGTIKNGDAVYLLEPGGRIKLFNVIGLAVQHNGAMNPVEEATDCVVGVKIYDIDGQKSARKFGVLTSIKPQLERKEVAGIENPYIRGLTFGYRKFSNVADYINIFVSELLMSTVLLPIYMTEGGPAVMRHVNKEGREELTVFTDKYELMQGKWGSASDTEKSMQASAMWFTDCIKMACERTDNIPVVTVNPYGGYPVTISSNMLFTIYQSEEYSRICKEQKTN